MDLMCGRGNFFCAKNDKLVIKIHLDVAKNVRNVIFGLIDSDMWKVA